MSVLFLNNWCTFCFRCQDREVLSEMIFQRSDLPIFFVVSKLEPEDREESSDEDEEASASARKKMELKEQSRKKQRVYEKLVKYGYLSAESGVTMDENERFHGLSAWRIQRYNEMKEKNLQASSDEFSEYIESFKRFQVSLEKFAEESLRARVEHVCQILIRVLSRCLDFFIQKANVLKKGKKLMIKTLQTLLQEEQEVHDNISRSLDDEFNNIQDILTDTFNNARDEILKEAANFDYLLTEFNLPKDGFVTEKAAVAHCKDQLQRMVINKLQGEIKVKVSMMFQSRELFFTQLKERIKQIEEEITADGDIPSPAVALGKSLLSSYEAKITFEKGDRAILRFIKNFGTWLYDVYCEKCTVIINTITGKVEVSSKKWKERVVSNVLHRVDPSNMTKVIVSYLKAHFSACHEEFIGEVKKVQGLFDRGQTIKDEQRKKILEFAPDLAHLEMLAYDVMDRFRFGLPRQGELSVFACDNITTPSGRPCELKVIKVASEKELKDLTLKLHNIRYDYKQINDCNMTCEVSDRSTRSPPAPFSSLWCKNILAFSLLLTYELLEDA